MLCSPIISNVQVTKTLIDGGAGLNVLSVETFDRLQVPYDQLQPTKPFSGVTDGSTTPIGQIRLAVTHHGYNIIKMQGSCGIIIVACKEKDAVCSLERAYKEEADEDPNNTGAVYPPEAVPKNKKQLRSEEPQESGVSSGTTSGPAPMDGAPPS